jgi:hypothetical protein
MTRKNAMRMIGLMATLAAFMVAAYAQQDQNQNANPPQNQQAQQSQPAQQPQQKQKKGFWQKVRDASQAGQNVMQQGTDTVQQGRGTIQQTGQQVQGTLQQVPNQGNVQQFPNGAQPGADPALGAGSGFQGTGGGGAGACGPNCFDAGSFQANVSQMTLSQEGGWHVIRMNIQFHNSTDQPLVIAYHDGSMVMVDNNGNTYIPAGGNPGQLQGMGIDRGNQTDSQFQLGPGQTGYALFSVARGRAANSPVGTNYSYNLTIDELQLQNGALAIPVRMYNLNFPSLFPGTSNASFGTGAAPASGFVGNANRPNSAGAVTQQGVPNVAGQSQVGTQQPRQVGVAGQQPRMVNGKAAAIGASVGGTAAPQGNLQNPAGQRQVGVAAQQPGAGGNASPAAVGSTAIAAPQANAQNMTGRRQLGVAAQQPGAMVNASPAAVGSTAIAAPQGNAQNMTGRRQLGVAAQQPGIVNGKPAAAVPMQTRPASPMNNAAIRTPLAAAPRAPNAAASRPIPVAPAPKPAATTPPKKTSAQAKK